MAKDKISDYSTTANSNTDIGGINVDEGCAPSGINDAIRTLMAQLKTWQSGGQDVYIHPAGSASAPSITANGDTNTGIFFPAADTVGISTGGTERARVDSSGNLGLGVTPSAWSGTNTGAFQLGAGYGSLYAYSNAITLGSNVYYNTGNKYFVSGVGSSAYQQLGGVHYWLSAGAGTAGNTISYTQAMTLDASGNLALGNTTSLSSSSGRIDLTVNGTSSSMVSFGTGGTRRGYALHDGTDFSIASETAGALRFLNNGSERARIDSSGNFLVGTTSASSTSGLGWKVNNTDTNNSYTAQVFTSSTSAYTTNHLYSTGAGAYRFYVNGAGTVFATSTTITGISDQRLKENIRDLDEGLATVMALQPRKFDWKAGKGKGIANDRGFIAQEFENVFPDMIEEWKDAVPEGEEPYKAVNANLIPTLVKAIQELKAIVDAQAAEIAALKG